MDCQQVEKNVKVPGLLLNFSAACTCSVASFQIAQADHYGWFLALQALALLNAGAFYSDFKEWRKNRK